MPARVLAFLLAVVLLWSGLATVEAPRVVAQAAPLAAVGAFAADASAAGPEGTVEHHHLDDQPAQALVDSPAETPALLLEPVTTHAGSGASTRPRTWVTAHAPTPFLAGPLRPPCCTAFAG